MDLGALRPRTFTLGELVEVVAGLCARVDVTVTDERVRARPDERTLRYYQSLGLLDRPLRYDGRAAVYGYRHVLQAVAVKALQGAGYSLAQVQTALTGVPLAQLEDAVRRAVGADLPHDVASAPSPAAPASPPPAASPARPVPTLLAFHLADGLTVTVDPARVADPQALARALAAAALPYLSSNGDHP